MCELLVGLGDVSVLDVSTDSVHEAVGRVREHVDSKLEEGKLAIIAPRDLLFGMARMYEILRDGSPVEVRVFRDRDEARSWLGLTTHAARRSE